MTQQIAFCAILLCVLGSTGVIYAIGACTLRMLCFTSKKSCDADIQPRGINFVMDRSLILFKFLPQNRDAQGA